MDRSRTLPTAPTVRLLHYPDLARFELALLPGLSGNDCIVCAPRCRLNSARPFPWGCALADVKLIPHLSKCLLGDSHYRDAC